jgi:hypothetical protein
MKSNFRRLKCDKSTLRKIEIILRRGYYRKNTRQKARRGCEC